MYKITSNGNIVALCESVPYVRVVNGISYPSSLKEANGVVAGGNCYNLAGYNVFPGRPVAYVTKADGWGVVFDDSGKITITMGNVSSLQDVACEIDVKMEEIMEALCEVDKGEE